MTFHWHDSIKTCQHEISNELLYSWFYESHLCANLQVVTIRWLAPKICFFFQFFSELPVSSVWKKEFNQNKLPYREGLIYFELLAGLFSEVDFSAISKVEFDSGKFFKSLAATIDTHPSVSCQLQGKEQLERWIERNRASDCHTHHRSSHRRLDQLQRLQAFLLDFWQSPIIR